VLQTRQRFFDATVLPAVFTKTRMTNPVAINRPERMKRFCRSDGVISSANFESSNDELRTKSTRVRITVYRPRRRRVEDIAGASTVSALPRSVKLRTTEDRAVDSEVDAATPVGSPEPDVPRGQ